MICEMPYCEREAVFSIRRITTGIWYEVCKCHNRHIGIENLMELGHSKNEAIRISKEVLGANTTGL